jgi:hypothetical protein
MKMEGNNQGTFMAQSGNMLAYSEEEPRLEEESV